MHPFLCHQQTLQVTKLLKASFDKQRKSKNIVPTLAL